MYRIQHNDNNYNNENSLKHNLINWIYSTVNISSFKYEIIQYDTDLPQLLNQKFYVSANFSGTNCLLIFTKIKDKVYAYLVERKTLSYVVSKVNIANVKLTCVNIKLDLSIYDGSIFDGIFVTTKTEKLFIITDVYYFKGIDYSKTRLDMKLLTIFSYLEANYDGNNKNNSIVLSVNKLFNLDDTETLINKTIPKLKLSVRGICFYPEISGTKLIYIFNKDGDVNNNITYNSNITINSNTNSNSNTPLIQQTPKLIENKNVKKVYFPKQDTKDSEYIFEMKKTNIIDVYDLNLIEPINSNDSTKIKLKRQKICIAYIPNIQKSQWCKSILKDSIDGSILVNCKYHKDKNKWEPNEISTGKRPSFIYMMDFKEMEI